MASINPQVENALRTLFRRCVLCPDITPSCPSCPSGQVCSQSMQSCSQCAYTSCIGAPESQLSPNSKKGGGTNAGAIAGGVIGGVILIAVATFLVWKYCIRPRRQEMAQEEWTSEQEAAEKAEHFSMRRGDAASAHARQSIASTVLTRASNVIQIAYIPGVTNRSPPSTPGLLVPPVPALPFNSASTSPASTPDYQQDEHFFLPDMRASTFSGVSDSRSMRESVTPSLARSSVATTIYRSNAVVDPLPAQTVIRGKAAVVSVKSSNQTSPVESRASSPPPMMPTLQEQASTSNARPPPSPAFSVNSAFMDSHANTAKAVTVTARPVVVKKSSKSSIGSGGPSPLTSGAQPQRAVPRISLGSSASSSSLHARAQRQGGQLATVEDSPSEDDAPGTRARQSLLNGGDSAVTSIANSPASNQSPFSDRMASSPGVNLRTSFLPSSQPIRAATPVQSSPLGTLSAAIEAPNPERASRQPSSNVTGKGTKSRNASPFGDENELKE